MGISLLTSVKTMYAGNTKAKKAYLGSVLVYSSTIQIDVPTLSGTYTYTGSAQTPTWSGYDSNTMTIGGTVSATNAGTYTATFTPKDGYSWDAEGSDVSTKSVSWSIAKATGYCTLGTSSMTFSGGTARTTVSASGTVSVSSSNTGVATTTTSSGTVYVTFVSGGSCTITVTSAESDNYLSATATISVTCLVTYTWYKYNAVATQSIATKTGTIKYFTIDGTATGNCSTDVSASGSNVVLSGTVLTDYVLLLLTAYGVGYWWCADGGTSGSNAYYLYKYNFPSDTTARLYYTKYAYVTTTYSQGSTFYGAVTSTSSSAYPTNGYQNGYWYVKQ